MKDDDGTIVGDNGIVHYYDDDMNRWIREGKWNITIKQTNLLPEGLFEL